MFWCSFPTQGLIIYLGILKTFYWSVLDFEVEVLSEDSLCLFAISFTIHFVYFLTIHGLVSSSFKKSESNLILQILGASIAEAQVSINAVISFFSLLFLQKPRWEYSSWHSLCICKQTVASSFQFSLVCSLINNRHTLPRVKKPHFMRKPSLFSPLILAVQPLYYVFSTPAATSVRSTWLLTKSIKFMLIILFNEFLTVSGKEEIFSFILALPTTKRKEKNLLWHFDILYAMMLLLWWICLGILHTKDMNDSWHIYDIYVHTLALTTCSN